MIKRLVCVASCVAVTSASAFAVVPAGAAPRDAEPRPLNILLTNDDGWRGADGAQTPYIVALRDALKAAGHHVVVVAPGTDQSGQGGRISLPPTQLEVANPQPDVWTVTPGSPADGVFFAFDEIFAGDKPDLVISGMNPGNNYGSAVNHSGTVNAALTALEFGVPSLAVSIESRREWRGGTALAADSTAAYTVELVEQLQGAKQDGKLMPDGVGLNVNYPVVPGPVDPDTGQPDRVFEPKGTKATTIAGGLVFDPDYRPVSGKGGQPGTYTIGVRISTPEGEGTDVKAIQDGFVSVSAMEADHDVDGATSGWLQNLTRQLG